jgi:tetratricopeptide (TPR) repeat protein
MSRKSPLLVSALALALTGLAGAAAQAPAASPAAPPAAAKAAAGATDPTNAALQHAAALAKQGKYAAAIAELEALRKAGTASPRALSMLGTLYLGVGKASEAAAILKPLADAPDAEPAVLYNAGRAALQLHEQPAAQAYFQRSLTLEPASPAARELGLMLSGQGRVVEAYALLHPWAIRNPRDTEAVVTSVALALDLERTGEAEQLVGALKPDDPATQLLRGKILVQKGDGQHAIEVISPLLKAKHPPSMEPEIRRTLAEAYLVAGQPKQAEPLLTGMVNGRPSTALLLAKVQHKEGNPAAALATLKPFADALPADPKQAPDPRVAGGVAIEYGRLLAETGHLADGVAFAERATRLEPARQEAWQALQQLLITAGRLDEAKKAGEKAAALAPALGAAPPTAAAPPPPKP